MKIIKIYKLPVAICTPPSEVAVTTRKEDLTVLEVEFEGYKLKCEQVPTSGKSQDEKCFYGEVNQKIQCEYVCIASSFGVSMLDVLAELTDILTKRHTRNAEMLGMYKNLIAHIKENS